MADFKIGDIVARKSYGADISFVVSDVKKRQNRKDECILKGLEYRLVADADADDLLVLNPRQVNMGIRRKMSALLTQRSLNRLFHIPPVFNRLKSRPGKILHLDASQQFLSSSIMYYRQMGLRPVGLFVDEPDQSQAVRGLLAQHKPDILVLTGHDGIRKGAEDLNTFDSYKNSSYYAEAVRQARAYEGNSDRLFIFAGACQSYYEALISAGASFASSPGRVLVHSMDPVTVAQRVATTDYRKVVTPAEAVRGTISGAKGIGGIASKGRLTWS